MKYNFIKTLALTLTALGTSMAYAEDTSFAGFSATGSVAATTDYRFRGVTQSANNPAIQGGFTINHTSGAYLALWGSSVDFDIEGNSTETDASLGYASKFNTSPDYSIGYDVGVTYYGYIGGGKFQNEATGKSGLNFTEFYGKLNFADTLLKGDQITTGLAYSPDYWGRTGHFWYVNLGYSAPIADTGFTGLASVGYNKFKNNDALAVVAGGPGTDKDYVDYKFGVAYTFLGINAELAGVGTNISTTGMNKAEKRPYDLGAVFTLSKSF